jgi:hypothetical protein
MRSDPLSDTQPTPTGIQRHRYLFWLLWVILGIGLLGVAIVTGGILGYSSGTTEGSKILVANAEDQLQEQFELGVQDFNAGRFDLARQRFEYVLSLDAEYPGVVEKLAEVMGILNATATPTPLPPTQTPPPTRDLRPVEDIFQHAQGAFDEGDWNTTIDTLIALRREDPLYRVVEVDSLLYRTLLNRGVDKIRLESNLEGGIYDLALAERFGPLSAIANNWRNLARLYLIGSSFWEVYPEQAVYYFGLVASGAPFLRDASGWTARERYRSSLIHYADQLVKKGDVCVAQEQYALALAIGGDILIEQVATAVAVQCFSPTESALTGTPTETVTPTGTLIFTTITPTLTPSATNSITQIPSPSITNTAVVSITPTLNIPTPTPTATAIIPIPSETSTATP